MTEREGGGAEIGTNREREREIDTEREYREREQREREERGREIFAWLIETAETRIHRRRVEKGQKKIS